MSARIELDHVLIEWPKRCVPTSQMVIEIAHKGPDVDVCSVPCAALSVFTVLNAHVWCMFAYRIGK